MLRGVTVSLLATLALGLAACGEESGPPDDGKGRGGRLDELDSGALGRLLARQVAAPWPNLQAADGGFEGNVRGRTRYGDAALGYSLMDTGVRERNRRMVASGIKAISFAVAKRPYEKVDSTFENLAVTLAYRLGRRRLANDARFRGARRRWESFLKGVRLTRLPDTSFYGNHWLVESVYVLELLKTGLGSDDPRAILGGDRERARSLAEDLVNRRLVDGMRADSVRSGGDETFLLSDPPDNPLPYHGLSLGFYARAIRLLGPRATSEARELLRRAANAAWRLASPDGEVGYWGRNQSQAWGQSFTAYGAAMAAGLPGSDDRHDRRYEALARRALVRLERAYVGGRYGLYIAPSLRRGASAGAIDGLDSSAGVPSFAGLALMGLNWVADLPARLKPPRAGALRADREGAAVLGTGPSRFATVRRGPLWFAVKSSPGSGRVRDLRFDFGLVAYKRRKRSGGWTDVIPLRPYTDARPDSAGPVLDPGGSRALPFSDALDARGGGRVELAGGFRRAGGGAVRTGVVFRFQPAGCGVRVSWPGRAGDTFEYSAFFRRRSAPPAVTGRSVSDDRQAVTFSPPGTVSFERPYASASDAKLVRARIRWRLGSDRRLRVTTCAR